MKTFAWLFAFLLCANTVSAQEAKLRTHMETKEPIWVGQKATLVVELLAPGIFSGNPVFDLPQVPGMLLFASEGSPVVGTETIDGFTYTVQRHEIALFARQAKDFIIPSFRVSFNIKRSPLDKDAKLENIKTEVVHFTVKMPPGAENPGSLISASNLKVVETWKPEPGRAKVGDAFTRTITFTAPDVPGMAFPQFPASDIAGLGVYPKTPQVLDRSERGHAAGERHDAITYVCQRPGRYVIPAARMVWWDLDAQKLQTINFPAHTLDVAPNPATSKMSRRKIMSMVFLSALGVSILALFFWKTCGFGRNLIDFLRPVRLAPLNPSSRSRSE